MTGQALRESMRRWTTGVAVVTSRFLENEHGMTVNSFASVSLEPPLVMVAMDRSARTNVMVARSGIFGVTILASSQQTISDRFAGRDSEGQNRFDGIDTQRLVSGAPFIPGDLAFLDCQVSETFSIATHSLFIGRVVDNYIHPDASIEPLLYFNQSYRRIAAQMEIPLNIGIEWGA